MVTCLAIGMMAGCPTESSALAEAGLTTLACGLPGLPRRTPMIQQPSAHLEGLLTLPDDNAMYGHWAGKILTGDESRCYGTTPDPVIYTIDQQGNVEEFYLRVAPEDFDIIQEGHDLYCNDPSAGCIWMVPSWYFNEHNGDILVTQAGEYEGELENGYALLLILHWDADEERFVHKLILHPWESLYPDYADQCQFEHVTFAPIDL